MPTTTAPTTPPITPPITALRLLDDEDDGDSEESQESESSAHVCIYVTIGVAVISCNIL